MVRKVVGMAIESKNVKSREVLLLYPKSMDPPKLRKNKFCTHRIKSGRFSLTRKIAPRRAKSLIDRNPVTGSAVSPARILSGASLRFCLLGAWFAVSCALLSAHHLRFQIS